MRRSTMLAICALAAAALTGPAAQAQPAWPTKPIRMVVPFPPGGVTDLVARAVADRLSESLGQQILVENRAGAGGNIGAESVARAPADGYTLLVGTTGTNGGINSALYKKTGYDHLKHFAPIGQLVAVQSALVVNPTLPVKSVSDLVAYAKANPGKLNMASPGSGTAPHLAGELFKAMTGTEIQHVPYRGDAPALTDLLSGQVQLMVANLPALTPHIKSGRLRALAVAGPRRPAAFPELPTVAESGVPGYEVTGWAAMFAPAGTPAPVVQRLNTELGRILGSSAIRERFSELGAEAVHTTPDELVAMVQKETVKWTKLVKDTGATAD